MKKQIKLLILIVAVGCINLSTSAQETAIDKKGEIEFGIGINFFGPKLQMSDLMVEYGFDDDSQSWLFGGGTTENPHYSPVGFTSLISYSYRIAPRSKLGILFNYSYLDEVFGNSYTSGFLFVTFKNISFVPLYKFELQKTYEFQAGPALMINKGNRTSEGSNKSENYTKPSIGLLTGLSIKIWDSRVTFGKIGANYLLTYKNNMGPFTSSTSGYGAIPESKIGFSHLNTIFSLGFKL